VLSSSRTEYIFGNLNIKTNNVDLCIKKLTIKFIKEFNPERVLCGAVRHNKGLIELDIINFSKNNSIPVGVVLDEWQLYAQRFWNNNKVFKYLPDIIYCQDSLAKKEAIREGVPGKLLKVSGSPLYAHILNNKINATKKVHTKYKNILFISETIAEAYGKYKSDKGYLGDYIGYTEDIVKEHLIEVVNNINLNIRVTEKLHPSQYNEIVQSIKLNTKKEWVTKKEFDLTQLIKEADIIVGMMSAVLLESYVLEKKVFSYQPNLLSNDKCTASRRGYVKLINDKKSLYKNLNATLNGEENKKSNFRYPKFCNKNAINNILTSLEKLKLSNVK
jgi:UDP-N-acetylglucosamine 2-epimerase